MSLHPFKTKYTETSSKGRVESRLRTIRGRIDTTVPTTLQGQGFNLSKNGTGDLTVTYARLFKDVPAVTATAEGSNPAGATLTCDILSPTTSGFRVRRRSGASSADGILHFNAEGEV